MIGTQKWFFIDGKPYVNLDDLPTIEECDISSADCDIQVCIPHKIYVAGIGESIVIGGKKFLWRYCG